MISGSDRTSPKDEKISNLLQRAIKYCKLKHQEELVKDRVSKSWYQDLSSSTATQGKAADKCRKITPKATAGFC